MAVERMALVGASSVIGVDLKGELARAGYPGSVIELLDLDDHVGLVTEYGDEARIVLEAAQESLVAHRLACLCGDADLARRLGPAIVDAGGTTIDLTAAGRDAGVVLVTADGAPAASGRLAIPHPVALLLAPLHDALGKDFAEAVVTVLVPASEAGDGATEELAGQAAALLSFAESPDELIGRRLAYDAWIDATAPHGLGQTIAAELSALGIAAPVITALRAGVFHGVAANVFLPGAKPASVREKLTSAGVTVDGLNDDGDAIDSPARVVGQVGIHARVSEVGSRGASVWMVADNHWLIVDRALAALHPRLPQPGKDD